MLQSRRSRSIGVVDKAYIDGLEAKVVDRCRICSESPCSLVERKAALVERHCCLEKGGFSGLRQELLRHRRQRRKCGLRFETC